MIFVDDRTPAQKKTHHVIILGTDRFLSGWGPAKGGPSYAGWACRPQDRDKVERWVRSRSDIMNIREVTNGYRPRSGPGHCHIYCVDDDHRSLT